MLPGETVGKIIVICTGCNATLHIEILYSNAGHYLGFVCDNCGPYSRETGYMTKDEAEIALLLTKKIKEIPSKYLRF